ncbi:MAG: hypothetical protein ACK417_07510 [Bacteroidia bacterium]
MRYWATICAIWLMQLNSLAQEPAIWWEEWLEEQSTEDDQQDETQIEEILLLRSQLMSRPLDLNKVGSAELQLSGLLNTNEIQALLQHKAKFGPLIAWYELQAIPGFSPERIAELRPYCIVNEGHVQEGLRQSFKQAQQRILIRSRRILQEQAGYDPSRRDAGLSHYAGHPQALLIQYRHQGHRHSMALNLSRDPGEVGIDRIGGHVLLKPGGALKELVVGDFHLQLGQGLIANTSFMPGRSAGITASYHPGSRFTGASGNQTWGTYRGMAARVRIHQNIDLVPWLFHMQWSARIEAQFTDSAQSPVVLSIQQSGRFRTPTELERRNNLSVQGAGLQLAGKQSQLEWQIQGQYLQSSLPFVRQPEWYRAFDPIGAQFMHVSFSQKWQGKRWQQFGEIALFNGATAAAIQHLLLSMSSTMHLQLSYRNYPAAYYSFFANSLRASSQVRNERGWLMMLHYQPKHRHQIDYYVDMYQHPWLRYRINAAALGFDQRIQWQYQPDKKSRLQIRLRQTERHRNADDTYFRQLSSYAQTRASFIWQQEVTAQWQGMIRVDRNHFHEQQKVQAAFALSYRLRYQIGPLRLAWQQSIFDAQDFDNRFYIGEPDVLYGQGIGMLSGQGIGNLLLLQMRAKHGLDFWFCLASTHFSDRDVVGSGLEQIKGPVRTEVRLQVQYRFR